MKYLNKILYMDFKGFNIIMFKVSISLKTFQWFHYIYVHHHKSTNTPKEGYKDLTTSLQHLMGFISMIIRILHGNDHIASKGHQNI